MRKQVLHTALAAALAAGLVLPAAGAEPEIGDVVGHTYCTDITAQINGRSLRSYNIGGETAVVAEDLWQYGFRAVWNEGERTLEVEREMSAAVTGSYQSQRLVQKVGTVAGDVLYTDIKTYVQGQEVESFNIGGETAIRLSDLERAGTLAWDEKTRTASLTLAENPMEFTLARMENRLKEAGFSYTFERYPGPHGTVAVESQGGIPHGGACNLVYVSENGSSFSVNGLLPSYGFGAGSYLLPRDIQFDGYYGFSFVTPIKATVGGEDQDWGECLCTVDTLTRSLQVTRLGIPLENWSAGISSGADTIAPDEPLTVTATRPQGAYTVVMERVSRPSEHIGVSVSSTGIILNHTAAFLNLTGEEGWASTPYKQAYQALSELEVPSVMQENFSQTNSRELREQAGQWFQVTLNGAPVSGDLWWSMGNNHQDLNFTYDQPISFSEGDVLTLWVGMPKEK